MNTSEEKTQNGKMQPLNLPKKLLLVLLLGCIDLPSVKSPPLGSQFKFQKLF